MAVAGPSFSGEELDARSGAAAAAGSGVFASVGVALVDVGHRAAAVRVVPLRQQQVRRRHARAEPARAQRVHLDPLGRPFDL